jgi:macrolide transport system ATP-binding/permease protein
MLRRRRSGSDFSAEIEAHIRIETERLQEQGLSEEQARTAARRAFGNITQTEERFYESRRWLWLDHLRQDIRFGLRMLRRSPGFTAVVVLTLALGIGANTAIFSLINAIALRSLPVPSPQQLYLLQWTAIKEPRANYFARYAGCPSGSGRDLASPTACTFSYPMFEQIRSKEDLFSGVFSFVPTGAAVRVDHHIGRLSGMYVSGEFFSTLGVGTAIGRLLSPNDDVPGAEPVIVLSYRYWQSEFGADPGVIGKIATVNMKPFRIIGITGRSFTDFDPGLPDDFWLPLVAEATVSQHPASRTAENSLWLYVLARFRPRVTINRAGAELNGMFVASTTSGAEAIFKAEDMPRITLFHAADGLATLRTEYAKPLYVLMTAVGLILLLACANVAGLILARSSGRQKEMAVRNALGAPRLRIVRQLLTESVMLSAAGGALGILFATLAAKSLATFLSGNSYIPLQIDVGIDWHVLAFTLVVSVSVGILFGLAPAIRDSRRDVAPILKLSGSSSGTMPRQSAHLSNILVVAQVVISVLVLVGAGLLGRTVLNLEGTYLGFKPENLLLFNVDMTASGLKIDDPRCDKLNEDLQNRLAALPGVISSSYSGLPLLSGSIGEGIFKLPGEPSSEAHAVNLLSVGPSFFETMQIPLVAGRTFTRADFDLPTKPESLVINQIFARKLFGKGDPLGRVLSNSNSQTGDWKVIGIVGDTKYDSIRSEVPATAFTPHKYRITFFELRTLGDPKALVSLVRDAVAQVNPDFLTLQMMTQTQQIDRTIYQERLVASLSTLFAFLALTLASIGLYGLVAYGVARRTHEIGVRMALGAQRQKILWLTARLGLVLTLIGVVLGLAVAAGVTRYLQSLLYGVQPLDSWTFACIAILLGCIAAIACYIPARRAMRVDPMVALRHE